MLKRIFYLLGALTLAVGLGLGGTQKGRILVYEWLLIAGPQRCSSAAIIGLMKEGEEAIPALLHGMECHSQRDTVGELKTALCTLRKADNKAPYLLDQMNSHKYSASREFMVNYNELLLSSPPAPITERGHQLFWRGMRSSKVAVREFTASKLLRFDIRPIAFEGDQHYRDDAGAVPSSWAYKERVIWSSRLQRFMKTEMDQGVLGDLILLSEFEGFDVLPTLVKLWPRCNEENRGLIVELVQEKIEWITLHRSDQQSREVLQNFETLDALLSMTALSENNTAPFFSEKTLSERALNALKSAAAQWNREFLTSHARHGRGVCLVLDHSSKQG